MQITGIVKGQEIKKNRDGLPDVRLLQVELSNESDVQTVQYMPMSGDDSPPQNGDTVVVLDIGSAFLVAVGVQGSVVPSMQSGEKKLFSRDGAGDIAAFVNFLTGGNLELNGNTYSAVRFAELQTAFNQLKSDFDLHVHGGVQTGAGSTAAPVPSTADITPAESVTVKLP